jgi:hypothetical protein
VEGNDFEHTIFFRATGQDRWCIREIAWRNRWLRPSVFLLVQISCNLLVWLRD